MADEGVSIKVAVRVRPFNNREKELKDTCIIEMIGQTTFIADPTKPDAEPKKFDFDFSYWSHNPSDPTFATQETIYKDQGEMLLKNSMEGFNSCLFAYGQTGSGKSHSVIGTPTDKGLLPRVCEGLFKIIEEGKKSGTAEYQVLISFLEIYNERIKDLLLPPTKEEAKALEIRQHPQLGVYIPGLTESAAVSFHDVEQLLDFGNKNRTIGSTNMNAVSSRSHGVFVVKFLQTMVEDGSKKQRRSQMNLVDLAGSERQKKTGAEGDRLKEGAAINQSLSNLGTVISGLAEKAGGKKGAHVPFRNSKLTYLLSDSLSGNSKTVMIAALSPAKSNYEETLSTLRFAATCKKVKTHAKKNEESDEKIVASLQKEIEKLKLQLMSGAGGGIASDEIKRQLAEREDLVNHYKTSWEEMMRKTQEMNRIREEAMRQMGLHSADIGSVFDVEKECPYLLNISDDPMLSGCLMYFLKNGEDTTIGSEEECTITLKGLAVHSRMCTITNVDNSHLVITVPSDGSENRVLVNGRRVDTKGSTLHHHDRLVIGRAFAFRLVVPKELETMKSVGMTKQQTLDENESWDLDKVLGEVVDEESQSFVQAKAYIEELRGRIGEYKAQAFLHSFSKAQKLVDEANDITKEIRPKDRLRFSLEVISDVYTYESDEPEFIVRLWRDKSAKQKFQMIVRQLRKPGLMEVFKKAKHTWKPDHRHADVLYAWELDKFLERLELMRDVFQQYLESGTVHLVPETDPWLEASPTDVAKLLDTEKLKSQLEKCKLELQEREEEVQSLRLALEGDESPIAKMRAMIEGTAGEEDEMDGLDEGLEEGAAEGEAKAKPKKKPEMANKIKEMNDQNLQEIRRIQNHAQEIQRIFGNMEDMYNEWDSWMSNFKTDKR